MHHIVTTSNKCISLHRKKIRFKPNTNNVIFLFLQIIILIISEVVGGLSE